MMTTLVFILVSSIAGSCITSYILFHEMKWHNGGWKLVLAIACNAVILGFAGVFQYPFIKFFAIILDSIIISKCIVHNRMIIVIKNIVFAMVLGLCEFISLPIYVFMVMYLNNIPNLNEWLMAIIFVFPQIVSLFIYEFYRHIKAKRKFKTELTAIVFQGILLPAFTFINCTVMIMLAAYYIDTMLLMFILLDIIFVIFMNIYLFYLFDKIKENNLLKQEKIRLEECARLEYNYYQKLEEKYQNSRGILHDVKRHLQVLENKEVPQDVMSTYIGDMNQLLQSYQHEIYSKHPIVNVILHEKFDEAKRYGIDVTCRIAPIDFDFMKEIDITVIFANLLDNAIDACKDVKERKYMDVCIHQVHDFVVFVIKNSAMPTLQLGISSKQGHEGLGLKNVKQTLEIYGGNMQVESAEHEFCIHLYIPMT